MQSKTSIKGIRKLQRNLEKLERRAKSLHGTHQIPLSELFNDTFLRKQTHFTSLAELLSALEQSGFQIESQQDWENIPQADLDTFVAKHTRFSSWQEMFSTAGTDWVSRQFRV